MKLTQLRAISRSARGLALLTIVSAPLFLAAQAIAPFRSIEIHPDPHRHLQLQRRGCHQSRTFHRRPFKAGAHGKGRHRHLDRDHPLSAPRDIRLPLRSRRRTSASIRQIPAPPLTSSTPPTSSQYLAILPNHGGSNVPTALCTITSTQPALSSGFREPKPLLRLHATRLRCKGEEAPIQSSISSTAGATPTPDGQPSAAPISSLTTC